MNNYICSNCIETFGVRNWIKLYGSSRVCSYCSRKQRYVVKLDEFNEYLLKCIEKFYGRAVEQLPYESREGGYQGRTYDTEDIIFDDYGLDLRSEIHEALSWDILNGLSDEVWCDYDWLQLDDDVAVKYGWGRFVEIIKKKRRFFFYDDKRKEHEDSYSIVDILNRLCYIFKKNNSIKKISAIKLWRARPDLDRSGVFLDYGPPPYKYSMQSNRMNPAGIPMMYLASSFECAKKESRAVQGTAGQWEIACDLNVLDLRNALKLKSSVWSEECSRNDILEHKIVKDFVRAIMEPVARDNSVHVDYLPSQVACEFFRDHDFDGIKIDGVAYPSAVHERGWNIALYVDGDDTYCENSKTMLSGKVRFLKVQKIKAE